MTEGVPDPSAPDTRTLDTKLPAPAEVGPNALIELAVTNAAGAGLAFYHLVEDGEYIIGRDREAAHILLDDKSVSRRHAIVRRTGGIIRIADAGSLNGTIVGMADPTRPPGPIGADDLDWRDWPSDVSVTVGVFTLAQRLLGAENPTSETTPEPEAAPSPDAVPKPKAAREITVTALGADRDALSPPDPVGFPENLLGEAEIVPLGAIRVAASAGGIAIEERDYLSIGGGLGSLAWVDHLMIYGVGRTAIRVIGVHAEPHGKWVDYCTNSQLSADERIRSNSASTPDNIWGFPGYALRETWRQLRRGRVTALRPIAQVFGEPLFAETYTPRVTDVAASIGRECCRLGWDEIFAHGRAITLRKTDDGRYVLAYRVPYDTAARARQGDVPAGSEPATRDRICIARHVHIATGYPATRVLPIVQAFRRKHPDVAAVVNAYEPHDALYKRLEAAGGTVIVEGRGIVASRIIQRLGEARRRNSGIKIIHVMRYPVGRGHHYDLARRPVVDDVEVQPFNWPKACWGGTLRRRLETADPTERARLMEIWGGTSTSDRRDWRATLMEAKREGWYRPVFGDLLRIRVRDDQLALILQQPGTPVRTVDLVADCLIDCTGLVADVAASPFLRDLLDTYSLPRNRASGTGPERGMSGIRVSDQFEIRALRNGEGRVYAAGVITANGPYAAVDSFLGLTYAALRSVDQLARLRAPGVHRMGPLRSFHQWLKWCRGVAP